MTPKIIAHGAEAIIRKKDNLVIKDRIKKSYRIPELDNKIRKRRTRSEIKLLHKAYQLIPCPLPLTTSNKFKQSNEQAIIKMTFINGKKLSKHLDNFPLKKQKQICKQIGENVAKLHDSDIIHGDLTTSNMIYVPNKEDSDKTNNKVINKKTQNDSKLTTNVVGGDGGGNFNIFFIDFGLGFISHKFEDKAVDLHLLRQALEAKHFKHWEVLFKQIIKGYKKSKDVKKVLERLKKVEKRGRYKGQ